MSNTKSDFEIKCAADIAIENDQRHIQVTKSHIVIDVEYPYYVELSRCNTAESILGWVTVISEKTWATRVIIRGFIHAACKANNVRVVYS